MTDFLFDVIATELEEEKTAQHVLLISLHIVWTFFGFQECGLTEASECLKVIL